MFSNSYISISGLDNTIISGTSIINPYDNFGMLGRSGIMIIHTKPDCL
jgi:hypothetical protein